ncbi:SCO4402 family protein [Dyella mobilis]|uniref:CdiI immunity protein domain-containing protein n=1 Tax=Dyella mobilis TaxID=1849582 RepID=A0ABS2KHJ9_9GAMM|nr:hypothetical protein [Dyella mobilis]MBM7130642.1 hypothetical protein [Dyella mobilis]GLQ97269.1 hypothetical protein GCM10007863_16890 [Dyella mobilis]
MADLDKHYDMNVSASWKREEMIGLLEELSDRSTQERLWIRLESYPLSSGIDDVFHFFFDDTDLAQDVNSEIGHILSNASEAVAIRNLCNALDNLCQDLGDVGSGAYISHPDWPSLVHLAQAALIVLQKPS